MGDSFIFGLVNLATYLRYPLNIVRFRRAVGYFPNVACPRRYNEQMLWRKIFDHNPAFVTFSDKLATKRHFAECCPELATAAVLWVGTDAATIPADVLATPVVVKASHGCGHNIFFNGRAAGAPLPVSRINGWLKKTHGRRRLEWAYGLAGRKLYAEEMIVPAANDPLIDLAVHATDGTPLFIEAITGNKTATQRKGYFRTDGTRWPELERKPTASNAKQPLLPDFRLPSTYAEAVRHTRRLRSGVDYARFDFLSTSDRLYGGEITVYPGSGLARDADFVTYNAVLSENWDLSRSWFLSTRHGPLLRIYANALRGFLKGSIRAR